MTRRKKNNIIITCLLGVVLLMVVGYAAFSSQLKISGTSSISSSWNIQITNIETVLPSEFGGGVNDGYNISEPTYTPTSATFNAGFELPGSEIYYVVEVSNLGSIDGQVTIGNLSCGDNSAIMCQAMATDESQTNGFEFQNGSQDYSDVNFPLKVGEKHYIMVMVGYADVTEQPTDLDASIKLDLTYEQYKDPNAPIPSGKTTLIGGQEVEIVSGGDGLYEDEYEAGRHAYKGANPKNYIALGEMVSGYVVIYQGEDVGVFFKTEEECKKWLTESGAPSDALCTLTQGYTEGLWRIIAKETDGTYKIVENELLSNQPWDSSNSNDWARPATYNDYLNVSYYNNLDDTVKKYIVSHSWGIGAIITENNDLANQILDENKKTWNGNIGLISTSDYLRANSNIVQCGTYSLNNNNSSICKYTNWLFTDDGDYWFITPSVSSTSSVNYFNYTGKVYPNFAAAMPVKHRAATYISSSITLTGDGSESNPFRITN